MSTIHTWNQRLGDWNCEGNSQAAILFRIDDLRLNLFRTVVGWAVFIVSQSYACRECAQQGRALMASQAESPYTSKSTDESRHHDYKETKAFEVYMSSENL
jgi:hypothetical protein